MKREPQQTQYAEPSTQELAGLWRNRAAALRRWAAAEGAAIALESAANELDEALRRNAGGLLTLAAAATESGYSVDHLGREISRGKIPNAGRRNAPRVRRSDLPKKPGAALPPSAPALHIERAEIARAVITRHVGGAR